MRIRQVKPAFWTDPRVAALPPAARLFYIGLWMEADDAGWLRWDVPQIANELYGYESRRRRERDVESYMALLVDANRVVIHPCGHVEIPTMTNHQHLSVQSKQVKTFWREHAGCIDSPANTRGDPPTPVETRASPAVKVNVKGKGNGDGKVNVNGKGSAPAKAPDGAGAITNEENLEPFLRVVNES
jgi:hypothetical protein